MRPVSSRPAQGRVQQQMSMQIDPPNVVVAPPVSTGSSALPIYVVRFRDVGSTPMIMGAWNLVSPSALTSVGADMPKWCAHAWEPITTVGSANWWAARHSTGLDGRSSLRSAQPGRFRLKSKPNQSRLILFGLLGRSKLAKPVSP